MNKSCKSKSDGNVSKSMFVGMHKNYLQVAVLDEKGKILNNSRVDSILYYCEAHELRWNHHTKRYEGTYFRYIWVLFPRQKDGV